MISEQTEEDIVMAQETKKGKKLLNEFCIWLNKANIDYKKESWGSGEGLSIIIGKVDIEFYESGLVCFREGDEE